MKYMIHACPPRMWYVEEFLIPSMKAQGIKDEEITVWNDEKMEGNLPAFLASMKACAKEPGGTWHIQDDVIISRAVRRADEGERRGHGLRVPLQELPVAAGNARLGARELYVVLVPLHQNTERFGGPVRGVV